MISTAVVGLWGTGICLIYIRTGFVAAEFSPKLWMKLIIVTALTMNAMVIGAYVMPVMNRFSDRPVLAIPVKYRLPMAVSAATSVFCWFTALALGSMAMLKVQPWNTLAPVIAIEYAVGLLIAISVALWARVPDDCVPAPREANVGMREAEAAMRKA
ncbi:hypothetical protein [Cognatiyoonia koreensis]|nr:hypothetical protein [Cognatiyoonia koreensis]